MSAFHKIRWNKSLIWVSILMLLSIQKAKISYWGWFAPVRTHRDHEVGRKGEWERDCLREESSSNRILQNLYLWIGVNCCWAYFLTCYLYESLFQDIHNPISKFYCIISWGAVSKQKTFYVNTWEVCFLNVHWKSSCMSY